MGCAKWSWAYYNQCCSMYCLLGVRWSPFIGNDEMHCIARPVQLFEMDSHVEVIMLCQWYAIDNIERPVLFLTVLDSIHGIRKINFLRSRKKSESETQVVLAIPSKTWSAAGWILPGMHSEFQAYELQLISLKCFSCLFVTSVQLRSC